MAMWCHRHPRRNKWNNKKRNRKNGLTGPKFGFLGFFDWVVVCVMSRRTFSPSFSPGCCVEAFWQKNISRVFIIIISPDVWRWGEVDALGEENNRYERDFSPCVLVCSSSIFSLTFLLSGSFLVQLLAFFSLMYALLCKITRVPNSLISCFA